MAFWNFQDTRYTQARNLTILSILGVILAGGGLTALFLYGNRTAPVAKRSAPAPTAPPTQASPPEPAPTAALTAASNTPAPVLPDATPAVFPELAPKPFDLAMVAIQEKRFPAAEDYLKQSVVKGERVEEALSFLAVILKENQKYAEAIDVLNRSIAQNPAANRFFNRAECYEAMGDYPKAKADFDKAVEKSPSNSLFTNKRYLFMIRTGHQAEVEQTINFQLGLGVTKNNDTWVMAAAALALKEGKPEIAATILKGATQLLSKQNFIYILKDPLFDTYRMNPQIRPFFDSD